MMDRHNLVTRISNDMQNPYSEENLSALEKKLGIKIKNREILKTAISRRAAKNEKPSIIKEDNERLEFLGDSVLKFLLSEYLYKTESNPEGKMTKMRIALEKNNTLSVIAKKLDFKQYMYLSEGEKKLEGEGENSLLADSLEAIIGAVYQDKNNMNHARKFFENKVLVELKPFLRSTDLGDQITSLQEFCQENYGKPPDYEYSRLSGASHEPVFLVEVFIDGDKIAEAEGGSKKKAKQEAAKIALTGFTKL